MGIKFSRKGGNLLREAEDLLPELRNTASTMASILTRVVEIEDRGTFSFSFRVDDEGVVFALDLYEAEMDEDDEEEYEEED
jgi:hypothetical protein